MWNPFKAVGDFIGRVSGAVSGGIRKATEAIVDVVRAPFGGREEASTPSAPPEQPLAPPEQPLAPPEPTALPPAPSTDYEPMLPPSMVGGGEYGGTTEISGESEAELGGAVSEFDAGGITSPDAVNWLEAPNFIDIFNQYTTGAGFAPDQWIGGMKDARNFEIKDIGDGMIEVSFEADFEIDGESGDIGTRTVTAIF